MRTLLIVCNMFGGLFGLYFVFTSLAGLIRRQQKKAASQPPTRRIAAVIAARNESAVIGNLVRSLMEQDYPRDLFDVYVVPNNCTDNTEEVARKAGAKILICNQEVHSKGDALRCAFATLTSMEDGYDAYCIFDADNLADPHFFQAVNDARAAGHHVAQGYRDSKNPYDSWVSGSMSVFYWFMSRFYNGSRSALGMSCALNGTGFMVSDHLIREIGWNTYTLTEDLEFSAQCALNGYKIGWMPDARVYDEQPIRFVDSVVQRRRWSSGSLQCMRRYAKDLLKKGTVHGLDMALLFLGMLLNLVGVVTTVDTVYQIVHRMIAFPECIPQLLLGLGIMLAVCYLAVSLFALLLFILEHRLTIRCLPAILLFALFLVSWMPINLICFFTRAPKWKVIRHTSNLAAPE